MDRRQAEWVLDLQLKALLKNTEYTTRLVRLLLEFKQVFLIAVFTEKFHNVLHTMRATHTSDYYIIQVLKQHESREASPCDTHRFIY